MTKMEAYVEICKVFVTHDQMENRNWLWNYENRWNVHWHCKRIWIINENDMLLSEGIMTDFFF